MPANQNLKDKLIKTADVGSHLKKGVAAVGNKLKSMSTKHPPMTLKGHGMRKANHGLPRNPFAPPNSNQIAKPPPDPRERAKVNRVSRLTRATGNRGKQAPTPPKGQGTGTHPNRPKSVGSYFGAK